MMMLGVRDRPLTLASSSLQIWLDYIKFLWTQGKHSAADELRKRAMENLKGDLGNVQRFELNFTLIRNEHGMEVN
jgi:hypothetical protein